MEMYFADMSILLFGGLRSQRSDQQNPCRISGRFAAGAGVSRQGAGILRRYAAAGKLLSDDSIRRSIPTTHSTMVCSWDSLVPLREGAVRGSQEQAFQMTQGVKVWPAHS